MQAATMKAEGFVGTTNWALHYDADKWLKEGRFDLAVVIAQVAYSATRKRVLKAKPSVRSVMDRRLKAHASWPDYDRLRVSARNAFEHEGQRPNGRDARRFVECVGDLMIAMEALA
jgi:hypothetical protein